MCLSNSRRVCTTSSAAAEGVEARTSATKSAMVKSVSWPTPEITGISEAKIARATISSLKGHRSSMDPPPRARISTSTSFFLVNYRSSVTIPAAELALDAHGIDRQMHIWKAARENADDVAHGGAARRGDDADAAGEERQGLLARSVEQALSFEAFLQLLEGKLQRAAPNGLEIVHVNLIFAAGFVDAYGAAHGHQQAVFGAELDAALLLLEINAADLSAIVFQGEVDVAGLGLAAVGDFPLDADVREVFAEQVADLGSQLADGPGLAVGHEVEGELLGQAAPFG